MSVALKAGKHIFVEKTLYLTLDELNEIENVYVESPALLFVGFNRLFAPHIIKMKELLEPVKQPKTVIMTMDLDAIPSRHLVTGYKVGGGRIIGEACHYIDLMRYLAG